MQYARFLLLGLLAGAFFGERSLWPQPTAASEPLGVLSVDASPGDNTPSSVGPIGTTASVTDSTCSDGNPEIFVDLVIGNFGTADGVDETGGIPAGKDIAGWQARIEFDPAVLTFMGFQVSDPNLGAAFYMEKAADHTPFSNPHITVSDPTPGTPGVGTYDIGSSILRTPAGANGVGLLARLFFDCVAAGGTFLDIADSLNSFYADIDGVNHNYAGLNSASLSVSTGTPPIPPSPCPAGVPPGTLNFSPQPRFPAGRLPRAAAVADVNDDGAPDVVTANTASDDVSVLIGDGDGTYEPQQRFAAGEEPYSVAVADLDRDGALDLVTANHFTSDVSVLLGNGDGSFQPQQRFAAGAGPTSVAIADLDRDGAPDVVTANDISDDGSVLIGNGDGTFQLQQPFPAGSDPHSVAVADLDGDGAPDVVTANLSSNDVSVLMGNGDGTFKSQQRFPAGGGPFAVAVADLDGDGAPDIMTANEFSFDVSVLLGNGDGTFQPQQRFPQGAVPVSVAAADLDSDGTPDVVTANYNTNDVSVLIGNGDGTFQNSQRFAAGFGPYSVAVADLDADGAPDLITANANSHDVSVLLQGPTCVLIDIKPGSDPNSTNLGSTGLIPVAIHTTPGFDAASVDASTVEFEGASPPVHDRLEDVDGDGDLDLIMHLRTQDTVIGDDDTEACLTGETTGGQAIEGCDTIRIVPPWLDSDGDGFGDAVEATLGTDQLTACPVDAGPAGWPPDPRPLPGGNGVVQIDDVTFAAGAFGSTTTPRAEIASQNGVVQIDDVTAFAGRFGQAC
jgi:hypothetical protein